MNTPEELRKILDTLDFIRFSVELETNSEPQLELSLAAQSVERAIAMLEPGKPTWGYATDTTGGNSGN